MIPVPPMRYAILCVLVLLALLLGAPGSAFAGTVVSTFYYPWFGTDSHDGDYAHWAQDGHSPPDDIASNYYPAVGVYSSSSAAVLNAQMADVTRAGINEIVVSWWGKARPRTSACRP